VIEERCLWLFLSPLYKKVLCFTLVETAVYSMSQPQYSDEVKMPSYLSTLLTKGGILA
jgi:hypothetical protein